MPELPEVETIARQLDEALRGRRLVRLDLLDPKLTLPAGQTARLAGARVRRVLRVGKRLAIELALPAGRGSGAPPACPLLCVHLRMTGRLLWRAGQIPSGAAGEGGAPPGSEASHVRARLLLEGGTLLFDDVRRFGRLDLVAGLDDCSGGGLDPLSPAFGSARLAGLLARSSQPIKSWLMRQDRLAGIGNIYASEILFAARLSPFRAAGGLQAAEVQRLAKAIRGVLRRAVACCGTTFSDYQDSAGRTGGYQRHLTVYGRAGEPCRVCRHPVARQVMQGRSTFFCPVCQPSSRS